MTKTKKLSWLQLSRRNSKLNSKNITKRRGFKKENPVISKFKKIPKMIIAQKNNISIIKLVLTLKNSCLCNLYIL